VQQLFVLNSQFMHDLATSIAGKIGKQKEPDNAVNLRALYHQVLARDPTSKELDRAMTFLSDGTLEMYALALLETNEEILWP
jgi:hypothetical protein